MAAGTNAEQIRRALGLALALAEGRLMLDLEDPDRPRVDAAMMMAAARVDVEMAVMRAVRLDEEDERLRAVVAALSFVPLPHGIRNHEEALHILGFPPGVKPAPNTVRGRFRALATMHHPDNPYGSHERMSQLNAAVEMLREPG